MKTNEIRITIKSPPEEVFEFTVEPTNTPKWIDRMEKETINTEQIGLGTIYKNTVGELEVTDYDKDVFFELTNKDSGRILQYSCRKIDDDTTEFTYFECMEDGSDLEKPMEKKHFKKLKELMEK